MFGFFKDTKVKAEAFTDGCFNIKQYTGINIDKMTGMEKSDLMDRSLELLKKHPDLSYSTTQMVIATWQATIEFAEKQTIGPTHPLYGNLDELKQGLEIFKLNYANG